MKIGLIGYGAMGRMIARLAGERGREIALTLDIPDADRSVDDLAKAIGVCDVAVDFSIAEAVPKNSEACAIAQVPLVVGTTGWLKEVDRVRRIIEERDGALIYGANFSIGVQIFYRIATRAAELFRNVDSYDPFIEEAHHKRKRDAPSGTALHLQSLVGQWLERDVPASSTRAGYIPGTHRLGFDSAADQIRITHEARSREGFAAGALMAAEWIVGRKGFYEFSEVFDEIICHGDTEARRK
ncbi:MAG TPA: dihydrodipicolinate reductase C-terminal domain-containing protein [Pyrinomonadaceae bacterium]|jgi:4-hydroxy-tetrahydrodipicolinate reductase|nr:dihydrodipicolinate reductase C-terminal domain-containing protein [Pyrinomonadaceae bacterium]